TISADDAGSMSPWGTLGAFQGLSWYLLFILGVAGQPHVVTKMMMNRRIWDAKYILPVAALGYAVSALLWVSIGLAMRALVTRGMHPELEGADSAAPQFLAHYVPPVLAGLVFAALFAAIMSTADGFLNIGAAAVVHDIPRALRGRSLVNELFWARTATVIIAAVASVFALYSGDLVAILGAFGWGTFAAALVPVVALGLNWKRATALAAKTAILVSLSINFAFRLLDVQVPWGIDPGAISLLVSLTLFVGISLASPRPVLDPDIDRLLDT
ncbi:MAG: sodium/proline symporter, partial [Candidatus Aminicenantes bacterium]|nr:sodium/proline symporter [Candidatus Aminicenantes bacterium]